MYINIGGTDDSLNMLKLCILYFDDVVIEIPWFYDKENTFHIENEFTNQLFYLEKYFDVKISFQEFDMPCFSNNRKTSEYLHDITIKNAEFIYKNVIRKDENEIIFGHDTRIRDKDFENFIKQTYAPYVSFLNHKFYPGIDEHLNSNLGLIDYSNYFIGYQMGNLFNHFAQNEPFISDFQIINNLLERSLNNVKWLSNIKEQINLNCVSILLPNLSYATFEDVFEMKNKMKDELLELQAFIYSLWFDVDIENVKYSEEIIINKIKKSIRNLEFKMKDIKINTVQKFITEIKNPLSYAPLIGSLFTNTPNCLSLFTSLGLIGTTTVLEYVKGLNNIKNDSMYFLFKLRK